MFKFSPKSTLLALLMTATSLTCSAQAVTSESTFVFADRLPPNAPAEAQVAVAPGIVPGVRVVFDISPSAITLRRAADSEESNAARAVYSFEVQEDRSVVFYEVIANKTLKQWTQQAQASYKLKGGAAYEAILAESFLSKSNAMACFPPGSTSGITMYVAVDTQGKTTLVRGVPEGSVVQCIIDAAQDLTHPVPPKSVKVQYTARLEVKLGVVPKAP